MHYRIYRFNVITCIQEPEYWNFAFRQTVFSCSMSVTYCDVISFLKISFINVNIYKKANIVNLTLNKRLNSLALLN